MSVINDAQTNRVCALSITITSYFCLNTAQYIVYKVTIKASLFNYLFNVYFIIYLLFTW